MHPWLPLTHSFQVYPATLASPLPQRKVQGIGHWEFGNAQWAYEQHKLEWVSLKYVISQVLVVS